MHTPQGTLSWSDAQELPSGKTRGRNHLLPQRCQISSQGYSQICYHSTCCITLSRRHLSSFQPVVTWAAPLGQSPPDIPAAQFKYQGRGCFPTNTTPSETARTECSHGNYSGPKHLQPSLQGRSREAVLIHTAQGSLELPAPLSTTGNMLCIVQTVTHHLPQPAAVRCCESQCSHLLLTVHSGPAPLQETGIIAFHLQEDKRIKPSERFR